MATQKGKKIESKSTTRLNHRLELAFFSRRRRTKSTDSSRLAPRLVGIPSDLSNNLQLAGIYLKDPPEGCQSGGSECKESQDKRWLHLRQDCQGRKSCTKALKTAWHFPDGLDPGCIWAIQRPVWCSEKPVDQHPLDTTFVTTIKRQTEQKNPPSRERDSAFTVDYASSDDRQTDRQTGH